jgi:predicted DNA-binding protein (MmcQ/YjbR family)
MKTRELVRYCASRPAAAEDHPWGASPTVFKVGGLNGPMFAIVSNDADPPQISLKCDPDLAEAFQPPGRCGSMLWAGYQRWSEMWRTCG